MTSLSLLAIDTSAVSVSVAVLKDEFLLCEAYSNTKFTHSATLMPMISDVLDNAKLKISDIDSFAVNVGPGSFTGIRIGVSAIKGLAFSNNSKCFPVSTLHSMAYNMIENNCVVCACMDARCSQVYTALFEVENGKVKRLTLDDAKTISELKREIIDLNCKIILVGDGSELCFREFDNLCNISLAGPGLRYQRASSVALCALREGESITPDLLLPTYLRPSQAERELKNKFKGEIK